MMATQLRNVHIILPLIARMMITMMNIMDVAFSRRTMLVLGPSVQ